MARTGDRPGGGGRFPAGMAERRRSLAQDRRGTTAIEFAALALPFCLMIFGLVETSLIFVAEMTLDRAVEKVGRMVRTGEIGNANLTKEQFAQRICTEVSLLFDCSKLKIDLSTYTDYASIKTKPPTKNGQFDYDGFGYDTGAKDKITALRVFYEWPVMTDLIRKSFADSKGNLTMMSIAAVKTEAY